MPVWQPWTYQTSRSALDFHPTRSGKPGGTCHTSLSLPFLTAPCPPSGGGLHASQPREVPSNDEYVGRWCWQAGGADVNCRWMERRLVNRGLRSHQPTSSRPARRASCMNRKSAGTLEEQASPALTRDGGVSATEAKAGTRNARNAALSS